MVSVSSFAEITKRVIAQDGFEEWLPTALYPTRKHVVVLEGAFEVEDLESIAVPWAERNAVGDEEFLVAFKIDQDRFKVVRRYSGGHEQAVFQARDEALPDRLP